LPTPSARLASGGQADSPPPPFAMLTFPTLPTSIEEEEDIEYRYR
jgi:hypothetical protein